MKDASWTASVRLGIDRRWRTKRFPAELLCGFGHMIREPAAAQRRHRVFALPGRLKNVAARIDFASQIAGLAADADFVLHDVIIRLEVLITERPVLERRTLRNRASAVAPDDLTAGLEIPGIQP